MSERERMVTRLQESARLSTLTDVGWNRVMGLSGGRLPMGGDQLSYPSGAVLEPLRQSLLTYNTYVSALDLPTTSVPRTTACGMWARWVCCECLRSVAGRAGYGGEVVGGDGVRGEWRVRAGALQRVAVDVGRVDPPRGCVWAR